MLQPLVLRWVILNMINLIPIEEKKEIKKDFYYRFLTALVTFFCIAVFISLIMMVPSYLVSLEKKNLTVQRLNTQKNELIPEIDQKALVSIKDLDTKLALIENARKNKFIFSEKVINEISSKKLTGIKINSFFYQNDFIEGKKISITGVAQDREQLLLFRQALEEDDLFKNVDLPISNFVKGSDIEFNLNLISI